MSGTIGTLLRTVISRIGLQDIIAVTEGASKNANWRFDRYCDAWSACPRCCAHQDCGCASPQRRTA